MPAPTPRSPFDAFVSVDGKETKTASRYVRFPLHHISICLKLPLLIDFSFRKSETQPCSRFCWRDSTEGRGDDRVFDCQYMMAVCLCHCIAYDITQLLT